MSRDVQRWKDKYLENIEQQERLQRRWDAHRPAASRPGA